MHTEDSTPHEARKPAPEVQAKLDAFERGPHVAHYLSQAGLRVLRVAVRANERGDGVDKSPRDGGWGRDAPDFTIPAEHFSATDATAILCGPCPLFGGAGADELVCVDLDGEHSREQAEIDLGAELPPTLSTKRGHHWFYRAPAGHPLRQWADVAGTKAEHGRAIDLKIHGYAIEPFGAQGFRSRDGAPIELRQVTRELLLAEIAELPAATIASIVKRNGGARRTASAAQWEPGERQDWPDRTAHWNARDHELALDRLVELGPVGNAGLMALAAAIRSLGYGLTWSEDGTPSGPALQMFEAFDVATSAQRPASDWTGGERRERYWTEPEWLGAVYRAFERCGEPSVYEIRPTMKEGIQMVTEQARAEHEAAAMAANDATSGATVQLAGYQNDLTAIREHLAAVGAQFRFNLRQNAIEWSDGSGVWRAWTDHDTNRLIEASAQSGICGMRGGRAIVPPETHVQRAVAIAANANEYDPVFSYLDGLPRWDGVSRIDRLLVDHFRCEDTLLARAAARVLMCGAVLRAVNPGCKLDLVVTIMGVQGSRKSSALRWLFAGCADGAGEFFSDPEIDFDKAADAAAAINGSWCVEIAEVDKLSRHDQGKVKSAITRQVDRVRLPYGRVPVDLKRRGVCVATINVMPGQDSVPFLSDQTGNRRWLAVFSAATQEDPIDLAALASARDQLWAEAVARAGEEYASWLTPAEEAAQREANEELTIGDDAWEDRICDWLKAGAMQRGPGGQPCVQVRREPAVGLPAPWECLRASDVLEHALGIEASRDRGWEGRRVGVIMGRLGWRRVRVRLDGRLARVWGRAASAAPAGATAAA